jgi:hypothetical protein
MIFSALLEILRVVAEAHRRYFPFTGLVEGEKAALGAFQPIASDKRLSEQSI